MLAIAEKYGTPVDEIVKRDIRILVLDFQKAYSNYQKYHQTILGYAPITGSGPSPWTAIATADLLPTPREGSNEDARRWSVWTHGFVGHDAFNVLTPNLAGLTASGTTRGADFGITYNAAPDLRFGGLIAVGASDVAVSLGQGRSHTDFLSFGLFGVKGFGNSYLASNLGFTNMSVHSRRSALFVDSLSSQFSMQSYSGRIEVGHRFDFGGLSFSPYGALRVKRTNSPAIREVDLSMTGFGLNYSATGATSVRGEVGLRLERIISIEAMKLVLRAGIGYAREFGSGPVVISQSQVNPLVVYVAQNPSPPRNQALLMAEGELHLTSSVAVTARFKGDFGSGGQSYATQAGIAIAW